MEDDQKFYYVYSCDLDSYLQVKIGTLEGERCQLDYEDLLADPMLEFSGRWQCQCSDMYVEVEVFSPADGQITLPITTAYKAFTTRWNWNEWLTLPVRYCDLPEDAHLRFTVYEPLLPQKPAMVGSTTIAVFTAEGCFNQGLHDLRLAGGSEMDPDLSVPTDRDSSSDRTEDPAGVTMVVGADDTDQMERLSKLAKRHRNGQIPQLDWLDRLTFREIEMINEREKRTSSALYLMVEFPKLTVDTQEYTIVYFEQGADALEVYRTQTDIIAVADHEAELDNLLELKHHHLARSLRSNLIDRDLKPDSVTRDQLNAVVNAPPTRPTSREAQDLVWKYRFYLSTQSKALSKFLKCVNWEQSSESQQALELMARWAPIEPYQALELLGPAFTHPAVRAYAVSRLRQAPDEELLMYLLQLVQALRYESEESIYAGLDVSPAQSRRSSLILTSLGSHSPEDSGKTELPVPEAVSADELLVQDRLSRSPSPSRSPTSLSPTYPLLDQEPADLSSLLISRACQNALVANYFYWFMFIECDELDDPAKQDMRVRKIYLAVMKRFSQALAKGGPECRAKKSVLSRQQVFIDKLVKLFKTVAKETSHRGKKIERMRALLADPEAFKYNFTSFDPLPLPLDPEVRICGIVPEKTTLFKSALAPARLTFLTDTGEEYVAIFKYGDDLRQDQLILQIVMLMDKLLRRENLDLKLTPYKVLATSSKHGFVQFIDSVAVAEVLSTEGSILNYFRKHHPSETGPYGVSAEVMDTYIRSCAGYCVITYLLGVGDRHLDNLLLTKNGNLFHVDFGYILGRDPKPLPPPMKLSKEMVEGMGGDSSEHYQKFRKQCYTAFLHLRRHADVILHLFSLMVDANIPDIALEPDKTVRKVQDKFRLDLSDEEAVAYMQNMIDVSVTAVMAALVEQLHKFAMYWRK